jgi:hypothetical protein
MMANQCLVCLKHFNTAKGLKAHTSTNDPTTRIAHTCNDCKKSFYSPNALNLHRESPKHKEKARRRQTHVGIKATTDIVRPNNDKFFRCQKDLERHRDALAHRTTFHCNVCKEDFDTELTMGYHEHSSTHKRLLELAEFGVYVDTTGDNVSLYSVSNHGRILLRVLHHLQTYSSHTLAHTPAPALLSDSGSGSLGFNDTDDTYYSDEGGSEWKNTYRVEGYEQQDWTLCDSDCAWCGHCADGVDY